MQCIERYLTEPELQKLQRQCMTEPCSVISQCGSFDVCVGCSKIEFVLNSVKQVYMYQYEAP